MLRKVLLRITDIFTATTAITPSITGVVVREQLQIMLEL